MKINICCSPIHYYNGISLVAMPFCHVLVVYCFVCVWTVGTCLCTSLVSLRQNQLCQQGPSIIVTERFHPQQPFTVVAFETRCPSRSCSTPFKYFKWVRCGAITWLLDKHQFIHQAADGHTAAGLPPRCKTHEDAACSPSTKPPQTREKQQIVNIIYCFYAPQTFEKRKEFVISLLCMAATLKGRCMTLGSGHGEEN